MGKQIKPWFVADNNGAHTFIRGEVGDCKTQTLAMVWLQGDDFNDANAHLMAAAPQLAETLRDIDKMLAEDHSPTARLKMSILIRQVLSIAKAEGN